jgi:hypothetical protein
MYSIGDIIDKLIIENIKIYELRKRLHTKGISDRQYVEFSNKMNVLNKNRAVILSFLDKKICAVISLDEENSVLNVIKTYEHANSEKSKNQKNKKNGK